MDMRFPIILCQTLCRLSGLFWTTEEGRVGDGTPSSSQVGCQHRLILEDTIPSAEHHTFVIILTADCLTWIMNQKYRQKLWRLAALSWVGPELQVHS